MATHPPTAVLIVDDAPALRHVLRVVLETDERWDVSEAGDGLEAIARATTTRPGVIVLDQHMPRLDGLDALPALRDACPDAHIVMWSSGLDLADRALAGGADAYVDKAGPLHELLEALDG